ncbi:hypothetical protein POJ06DRAFT_89985 [Lipomyces tetrasporus]|uniref:DUF4185 domain-containing protein n=1 Tax=Lipomyces tetrasporus TaxID=54092 RepID=A0AAD7QWL5_9ASCO|nr:uncharacterized protein POJ06DRAFT_89985 [Lipomyces tetrasporus]KAJ8101162.1 hypothetical protein POJ06DRAFT_89985 [Lipomyces tetrasporus]
MATTQVTKGRLPINVTSASLLGDIYSTTTYCLRDNGFNGRIGDVTLISYGDTMFRDSSYTDKFCGMTSDSVAIATSNPLQVIDVLLDSGGWPEQFCPLNPAWNEDKSVDAMGITNIVETGPGRGIVYFLKNHRPGGVNNLVGAGVATVTMHGNRPSCTRLAEYWWDGKTEPHYGDICALKFGNHIYAYGHGPTSAEFVYVCRVLTSRATDLSAYEYWNGSSWQKERLYNVSEKEKIFWQIQSGQIIWSPYYDCLLFVYSNNFLDNQILAVTASSPTGPWSSPFTLHKVPTGKTYSATPHPNYDWTGKTLVCTYTKHPNALQAVKITFA